MSDNQAATRAYAELRQRIMTWQLPPGTRLREVELAAELNVSRTPVREALQRLRSDGLIAARGQRGNEVPRWAARELEDSYRMRANLEAWAARLATERLDRLDLPRLHGLADEMTELSRESEPDLNCIAELNIDFHHSISTAVGSERLNQMLSGVVHLPLLYRVFHTFTPAQVAMTLQEHHTILMALEARDADWAESITRAHILAALSSLIGAQGIVDLSPTPDDAAHDQQIDDHADPRTNNR